MLGFHIDTFETTLDCLMKELRSINNAKVNDGGSISNGENGRDNDSDSKSDSDSDSDSSAAIDE